MMAGPVWTWIVILCAFTKNIFTTPQFDSSQQLEHMKNVAVEKNCSMSSQYEETGQYGVGKLTSGNCSAAINGNNDTTFVIDQTSPNCIHTRCDDSNPFWSVDLGKTFSVQRIIIYGRKDYESRMQCVEVWLDRQKIFSYPCEGEMNPIRDINQNLPQQGQVVSITRNTTQWDCAPLINICEVQVWVCTAGWWGRDCQNQCSPTCQGAGQATGQTTEEDNYCDSVNGTCLKGCMLEKWGETCAFTCGAGCDSRGCRQSGGTCQCRPRWEAPLCQKCSPSYWGSNCSPCGTGCMVTCDASNGNCKCKDGWTGSQCTGCDHGRYGHNCADTCGHCADPYDCNNVTGACPSCKTGFNGTLCKDCSAGHYNVSNDCQNTCGGGCHGTCNGTDGTCQCHPGWQHPLCQYCAAKYYNASNDCVTCGGGCNDTCRITNGTCQCRPGWQPPLCQHCANSYYSISNDCVTCGEGCNNTSCNRTDGTCQCRQGWQPPLCQSCTDGHYNVSNDCQEICGGGCNDTCSRTNGTCPCRPGWQPPLCQQQMQFREDESSSAPVGAIIGPVVAVILVAGAVVVIVIFRRRGQHKGNQPQITTVQYKVPCDFQQQLATENPEDKAAPEGVINVNDKQNNKPIAPVKPQTYPKPVDTDDKHVYNNEQLFNAQRSSDLTSVEAGNENASAAKTKESSSPNRNKNKRDAKAPPTAPKPVAEKESAPNRRIYENIDLMKNLPKISENDENQKPHAKSEEKDQEAVNGVDEEEDIYNTEDIYASYRSLGSSSILDDLQKSLLASLASGKLGMEFAKFPKDMQHLNKVGSKPENSKKNRFKALCAYDHSRVVLRRPKGDSNTDYINASYIKGYNREKAYIATQGPRSHTVDDFWWMVWQENVTQIVMLTNIKEGGKDKCEEYWPPVGNAKTCGHVTVTALKTDPRADFVVRSFVVGTRKKGEQQRTVSQYHYLVWPDHGVPSTLSLVSFWRYVKTRAQGAIPVVHCSAGVGRTGTYIALDIASDLRSRGREVNVKEIVSRLREDRTLMVQTEAQYKFLHEAILEEYSSRATRMSFEQFDAVFPDTIDINNTSKVDKEFKMLNQMGMFVPIPKYTTAASKENMHKNRNREALPDEEHLIFITGHVPGRNQYINAVHMPSIRKRQGLILTQLPLPDTVVDMWRLVDGWNINTIVSLGHKDQSKSVKNYCHYWPETEDALKTEHHTIGLISTAALGDHLTCYNLSLTTKASKDKTVRVLYYDDWAGLVPGRISDVLHMIDSLESWHVEEDTSPVIVQCSDGVSRSGMFCALYDIINRARIDQEVDIYLPVRQVQTVRPQAFTTEVQYRYCYLAVQEYKRQQSVYQNM